MINMSDYVNKYCRIEWTIENFTREGIETTKVLRSDSFAINFGEKFEWHLRFATNAYIENDPDLIPLLEEENLFSGTNEQENKPGNTDLCALALCLNNPSIKDMTIFNLKDPLVIFRCYIKNEEKDKKKFTMKIPLANFEIKKKWGSYLNMIVNGDNNKFFSDKCLKFVVLISIHDRKREEIIPQIPNEIFFNNNLYSDFKIICNDRKLPVHRNILHTSSSVFAAMFQAPMSEAKSSEVVIDDVEGSVVLEVMRYVYTGKVKNIRTKAMDLLNAAEKYELIELKQRCIESLSVHLNLKNIFNCLILADRHNDEILLRNCLGFMKMYHTKIVHSKEWSNIESNILARAISASVEDFLQVFEFRNTLEGDSVSDINSNFSSLLFSMETDDN